MPYCYECGTQFEKGNYTCISCGLELIEDHISDPEETLSVKSSELVLEKTNDPEEASIVSDPQNIISSNPVIEDPSIEISINMADVEQNVPEIPREESTIEEGILENASTPPLDNEINMANQEEETEKPIDYSNSNNGVHFETVYVGSPTELDGLTRSQMESHLGKGMIKPQAVELGMDGVHFKFDLPPRNFSKVEPIKEKPKEYRATAMGGVIEVENEIDKLKESLINKPLVEDLIESTTTEIEEPTRQTRKGEPVVLQELSSETGLMSEESLLTDSDISVEPESVVEEVFPEPILPEPELEYAQEFSSVWEDHQTWFRIPYGNQYRITNRSLLIYGNYNRKLLEVSLHLITNVSLQQSWFAKLMGIGDLRLTIRDFMLSYVVLAGITEPEKVQELLEDLCNIRI